MHIKLGHTSFQDALWVCLKCWLRFSFYNYCMYEVSTFIYDIIPFPGHPVTHITWCSSFHHNYIIIQVWLVKHCVAAIVISLGNEPWPLTGVDPSWPRLSRPGVTISPWPLTGVDPSWPRLSRPGVLGRSQGWILLVQTHTNCILKLASCLLLTC